jgi:hypothetical protein
MIESKDRIYEISAYHNGADEDSHLLQGDEYSRQPCSTDKLPFHLGGRVQ